MGELQDSDSNDNDFQWSSFADVHLFYALSGKKIVGNGSHFLLVCAWHNFINTVNAEVSLEDVKTRLSKYYNLEKLAKLEEGPNPLKTEVEFSLPSSDFVLDSGSSDKGPKDIKPRHVPSPSPSQQVNPKRTDTRSTNDKTPKSATKVKEERKGRDSPKTTKLETRLATFDKTRRSTSSPSPSVKKRKAPIEDSSAKKRRR